jgi:hypothetical protein
MFPFLLGQAPLDAKIVDLKDGFVQVVTRAYTVEVPKGWTVSRETGFGQREFESSKGRLTAMTANAGPKPDWDGLYRTSLYFIMREKRGKATPYELGKTDKGYGTCSFSILNSEGFADRRYVLLHNPKGPVLALSVKIPDPKQESELKTAFDRLVRTARFGE